MCPLQFSCTFAVYGMQLKWKKDIILSLEHTSEISILPLIIFIAVKGSFEKTL